MSTTPSAPESQAGKLTFHVLRNVYWKGKRYKYGDTIHPSEEDTRTTEFAAWVSHRWVEQLWDVDAKVQPNRLAYVVLKPMPWNGVEKQPGDKIQGTVFGASVLIRRLLADGSMREFNADEYTRTRAVPASITLPYGQIAPTMPSAKPRKSIAPKGGTFHEGVPITTIQMPPWGNTRKDWTSEPARVELAELAQSIREQGIIEPLIVRPLEGGYFELVAGERRLRAAGMANLVAVPCIARDLTKKQAIEIQAIENLQRRDLNAVEEGEGYRLLLHEGGYTVPQIVLKTGKSEASIYDKLKLTEAPAGIRKAVIEGRLPATTASLVAREEDSTFRHMCMDAVLFREAGEGEEDGGVMSFRQAKAWIAEHRASFKAEHDWKQRQRQVPAFHQAEKVLSIEESTAALFDTGALRESQVYIRPTDKCFDDPAGRTFEQVAKEAGAELPKPVIARHPGTGEPVVLLPREATEKAIVKVVPEAEAQRHNRAAADLRRTLDQKAAERTRKEAAASKAERARGVVTGIIAQAWSAEVEETLLRHLVHAQLGRRLVYGAEDLLRTLTDFGVAGMEKEDLPNLNVEWLGEYVRGTDAAKLRGWLLYFHLREGELPVDPWVPGSVDEDRLFGAEMFLRAMRFEPQASAVADGEEAKI